MARPQIFAVILSLFLLIVTLEAIRRRRLKEEYSILWILTGLVVLVFSIFPRLLGVVSLLIGVPHLPTLFLIAFAFLLAIALNYSFIISKLFDRNLELSQRLAILEWRLQEMRRKKE
jgi:hypothetical protein